MKIARLKEVTISASSLKWWELHLLQKQTEILDFWGKDPEEEGIDSPLEDRTGPPLLATPFPLQTSSPRSQLGAQPPMPNLSQLGPSMFGKLVRQSFNKVIGCTHQLTPSRVTYSHISCVWNRLVVSVEIDPVLSPLFKELKRVTGPLD